MPPSADPPITRVFIPAIKVACVEEAGLRGAQIGYGFTREGALHTLDPGDGSVTGLPAGRLRELNDCLADYPIAPPGDLPRDKYGRNLLYDYYSEVLYGCLAGRVPDLSALPSRADFVVRLYLWDPYRELAPGRSLDELLALASACPAVPEYLVG
jgi:hypothetical protein